MMKTFFQPIYMLVFALLLSATTLVFGSMPLLWMRRSVSALRYLLFCAIMAVLSWALAGVELTIPFLINAVLVFCFVSYETSVRNLLGAALLGVFTTGIVTLIALISHTAFKGESLYQVARIKAEEFAAQIATLQPSVKIDVDSLLPQFPSAFLILLALSLWIALLSESPWKLVSGQKNPLPIKLSRLQSFMVPDEIIWILLISVLFSFGEFGLIEVQRLAINLLYISIILYFFQGIAVVGTFFQWQRVGPIWQVATYVVLITQLFLAVSGLGIADFWLDLRGRMVRKSSQNTGEV